jgi:hypothetical protein
MLPGDMLTARCLRFFELFIPASFCPLNYCRLRQASPSHAGHVDIGDQDFKSVHGA